MRPRARIVENLKQAPRKIIKRVRVRPITQRFAPRLEHGFLAGPFSGQMRRLGVVLGFGACGRLPQLARGKQQLAPRARLPQLLGERCDVDDIVP